MGLPHESTCRKLATLARIGYARFTELRLEQTILKALLIRTTPPCRGVIRAGNHQSTWMWQKELRPSLKENY
jgi:hypothetical protein